MADMSLRAAARRVAKAGRKGDVHLAHITPVEMNILKSLGGSGSVNPKTGLSEFFFGGAVGPGVSQSVGVGGDPGSSKSEPTEEEKKRIQETQSFIGQGGLAPAEDTGGLTDTQKTISQGLQLAASALLPGIGFVTGGAKVLELLFGPGADQGIGPAGTTPGRVERDPVSRVATTDRERAQIASPFQTPSENAATSRNAEISDPRVSQAAALARRQAEADSGQGRGGTVLTTLQGLIGGPSFARKKLLGR